MRTICGFTGSRADYGPLLSVFQAIDRDPDVDLKLLVSGGHLVPEQGRTIEQVQSDGFSVSEQVEVVVAGDTSSSAAKSFGLGAISYADSLSRLRPDILLLLGDRYEALAVAVVAALQLIPIAHIGGGEITTGSTDDWCRHAITKLAHIHFTSTEEFRQRVIQMGENPIMVHNTGAPALDLLRQMRLLDRSQVGDMLQVDLEKPVIVVTYHPATADPEGSRKGLLGLLDALDRLPGATIVFTRTNVDQGGAEIAALIDSYVRDKPAKLLGSLGQEFYLSLVQCAAMVVGNSSSGIYEAPALGTPTVNIGSRQEGRPRVRSIFDCSEDVDEIERAIRGALEYSRSSLAGPAVSPYGDGHAAERIVRVLKEVDLRRTLPKRFHTLNRSNGYQLGRAAIPTDSPGGQ
ncbi:UDP-N-acetylglucosamine 2-epimerase [Amycolatopsis sp. GM8]|uniref:UDP-N-acetylglucosamine 2-epimerase n=1 Tax=Amycolatopsis sp. GM8 TaxID=2896530 RepID=UPI002107BFB7|nr:UDP-N-acetylglucosamine 2-epimerase [Amycolatopsis sp. GM8]